jgi:chemotaxis protein methyltransferase CheR
MGRHAAVKIRPITELEFRQLSQLLRDQCGLHLHDDQSYLIETRLGDFVQSLGLRSYGELYSRLQHEPEKLLPGVINLMTTNETLWFRDESCWNAVEKAILPALFEKAERDGRRIKIWIAGCSTGQEAYSLAILIDELCRRRQQPELVRHFHIQAMDISQTALEVARAGRYNNFEIKRGLSLVRRNHYFERLDDGYWMLRPDIRLRVHFDAVNLTHSLAHLGTFDLIFCRNVTIYFAPPIRDRILSDMAAMLEPGGSLLLGATEPLWERKGSFRTVEFEGCVYINATP